MIELFKNESRIFFESRMGSLKEEISRFSDEKILNADIEQWVEYYMSKYQFEPLTLLLDNIERSLNEVPIEISKERRFAEFPGHYTVEGFSVTFKIPFDGDDELLTVRPDTFFLSRFQVDDVIKPRGEQFGIITIINNYIKTDLVGKDDPNTIIEKKFNDSFRYYIETIERINQDVSKFNGELPVKIRKLLEERLKKAEDFVSLGEKLNIPLGISQNAPNNAPLPLKRAVKAKPEIPKQAVKAKSEEYEIRDTDYVNIKNIINMCCVSMERAACTFSKLEEEELRDIILSNLNTHYDNQATGETFSKIGKTDLWILFENKAAYIAECKIWHGEKMLDEALNQLFGYTTWRDTKTSVVIFNKDNKNFNNILETIELYLKNNNNCTYKREGKNLWQCIFERSEGNHIRVYIQVYDLQGP